MMNIKEENQYTLEISNYEIQSLSNNSIGTVQ